MIDIYIQTNNTQPNGDGYQSNFETHLLSISISANFTPNFAPFFSVDPNDMTYVLNNEVPCAEEGDECKCEAGKTIYFGTYISIDNQALNSALGCSQILAEENDRTICSSDKFGVEPTLDQVNYCWCGMIGSNMDFSYQYSSIIDEDSPTVEIFITDGYKSDIMEFEEQTKLIKFLGIGESNI